jgi:ABC-type uncharacterized transport system ATPase subunit
LANVIEMRGVTKRFPGVVANDGVDLSVAQGEIHGLLGENGAGKTTLMNILYGLYPPDDGRILLRGQPVRFASPHDAIAKGIGMVHQHFMLIPVFTVAENLVLGAELTRGVFLDMASAEARVRELSTKYGLKVDPTVRVEDIPVGVQQRVEILKALYRNAEILILDEPTAVLTPQEVEELYAVMHALRDQGHTIIFITHKLREVLNICDRVTVLRDGKVVGTRNAREVTEAALARLMVGREVLLRVDKPAVAPGPPVLEVRDLHARNNRGLVALDGVSFEVRAGEIVGLAGVEGNGQTELAEVLTGLRRAEKGQVLVDGQDLTNRRPSEFFDAGVAHIPEDRHQRGLILDFSLLENLLLGFQDTSPYARGASIDYDLARQTAKRLLADYDVRAPSIQTEARTLSGGNQQKVILAREFERRPKLLVAAQPTRGLDVGATEFVRQQLVRQRSEGKAVLLISSELNEIMDLSDRIIVMFEGRIQGTVTAAEADEGQLGLLMAGAQVGPKEERHGNP